MPTPPPAPTEPERVYHVELRHFPRNVCRFNLSAEELRATVIEPWIADRPFELGELKWDPRQARLTVFEGPRIPPDELSMGRGWRTVQRKGQDVTTQLLAAAGEQPALGSALGPAGVGEGIGPESGPPPTDLVADSLGLELLAQMGDGPTPLRQAWELASMRCPNSPASETLAIAERATASLLRARLVVLLRAVEPEASPEPIGDENTTSVLGSPESWVGAQVWIRRI
jgi:hypothetical protein